MFDAAATPFHDGAAAVATLLLPSVDAYAIAPLMLFRHTRAPLICRFADYSATL